MFQGRTIRDSIMPVWSLRREHEESTNVNHRSVQKIAGKQNSISFPIKVPLGVQLPYEGGLPQSDTAEKRVVEPLAM